MVEFHLGFAVGAGLIKLSEMFLVIASQASFAPLR